MRVIRRMSPSSLPLQPHADEPAAPPRGEVVPVAVTLVSIKVSCEARK